MDRITLNGIVARGKHGANPGERDSEQPIAVDLDLELDLHESERTDRLEDTVDYASVHARILDIVATHSFALLERLAGCILDDLFSDARIARARISVGKPALLTGATPSVTLSRDNRNYRARR